MVVGSESFRDRALLAKRPIGIWILFLAFSGPLFAQVAATTAPKECVPPCSPGYLCLEGICIEACNPRCQPSERCTAERICVDRQIQSTQAPAAQSAGQPVPAKPPAKGTICAFRSKKLYAGALEFQVAVDDFRIAVLGRGEYACSTATAGIHRVTLSTPVAGYTHTAPAVSVQVDVAEDEATYLETSIGGGMLAPVMYLTPLSIGQAEGFMKSLAPAASERRQ